MWYHPKHHPTEVWKERKTLKEERKKKKIRLLEKQKEKEEINNNPEDISTAEPAEEVPAEPEMNDKIKIVDTEEWGTMTKSQRRNRLKKEKKKSEEK